MKQEEQIELIKPFMYCYMGSGMLTNEYDETVAVMMAKSTLEALEKANQLQNKWISVKDKEVPKDGKCYQVFMVGNQQDFVTWVTNDNGKEPYFRDYFYKEDVTNNILFWQQLPNAPISTTEV